MCHVLIIEDEPMIAMAIEMMVEEEGATSWDIAVTQDEAIAAALAHPPDIITSDVRLIAGTGPLAVAEIAARLGKRPVITSPVTRKAVRHVRLPAWYLSSQSLVRCSDKHFARR